MTDKVIRYTGVDTLMSRLYKNPLLTKLTLEDVLQYLGEFMDIFGFPLLLQDKEIELDVNNYRVNIPSDAVKINQVMDLFDKKCISLTTATFGGTNYSKIDRNKTYRIQSNLLITSFKKGKIRLSYKALLLDNNGFPQIPGDYLFLLTLELYIKEQYYTTLYEQGNLSYNVLANVKTDYDWRSGQLNRKMNFPSMEEMDTLTNIWTRLIPDIHEHRQGFKDLGKQDDIKLW